MATNEKQTDSNSSLVAVLLSNRYIKILIVIALSVFILNEGLSLLRNASEAIDTYTKAKGGSTPMPKLPQDNTFG